MKSASGFWRFQGWVLGVKTTVIRLSPCAFNSSCTRSRWAYKLLSSMVYGRGLNRVVATIGRCDVRRGVVGARISGDARLAQPQVASPKFRSDAYNDAR